MMTTPWHPWFDEAAITLRRRMPRLLLSTGIFVAVLGALVLAWMHLADVSWHAVPGLVLTAMAGSPMLATTLIAVAVFVLLRSRLQAVSMQLHEGWLAALPIKPYRGTVALLTIAFVPVILCAALFALFMLTVDFSEAVRATTCSVVVLVGLFLGAVCALLATLRDRRARTRHFTLGAVRQELFGTAWLDDRRLPHISDWQRRLTVMRWRSHASAALALPVLLSIPTGGSMAGLIGLMLFALSAGWLGVALRACTEVASETGPLLNATPVQAQARLRATLRYPMFATACASVIGLSLVLASGSWSVLLAWLAVLALFLISKVPVIWQLAKQTRKQPL